MKNPIDIEHDAKLEAEREWIEEGGEIEKSKTAWTHGCDARDRFLSVYGATIAVQWAAHVGEGRGLDDASIKRFVSEARALAQWTEEVQQRHPVGVESRADFECEHCGATLRWTDEDETPKGMKSWLWRVVEWEELKRSLEQSTGVKLFAVYKVSDEKRSN